MFPPGKTNASSCRVPDATGTLTFVSSPARTVKATGCAAIPGPATNRRCSPGAIGACATPSRVFKGMRMAGQMGNERVTVLNLEVVQADPERNLLLVRGAVPGPDGGLVMVRSATKAPATAKGAA